MQVLHLDEIIFNLKWRIYYLIRLYIKHIHDCDNCGYFGGCMCDHIDENGKCLGWKNENWYPLKYYFYHRKIKKVVKWIKKNEKSQLSELRRSLRYK